jgi:hypothetical protein
LSSIPTIEFIAVGLPSAARATAVTAFFSTFLRRHTVVTAAVPNIYDFAGDTPATTDSFCHRIEPDSHFPEKSIYLSYGEQSPTRPFTTLATPGFRSRNC